MVPKLTGAVEQGAEVAFDRARSPIGSILEFAREVAMAVSAVVKLNVSIFDADLFKLVDSDAIDGPILSFSKNTVAGHILLTGEPIFVAHAREDALCQQCPINAVCSDKSHIVVPIKVEARIVGNFFLNAKTDEQHQRLLSHSDDYIAFLEKMANLLANKIMSEEKRRQVIALEKQLNFLINEVDHGYLYADADGLIRFFNDHANRFLGRGVQVDGKVATVIPELSQHGTHDELLITRDRETFSVHVKTLGSAGTLLEIQKASAIVQREREIRRRLNRKSYAVDVSFSDLVGNATSFQAALETAKKYARVDATVLISAETGTGKELFAKAMHRFGRRKDSPFVAVNCAALPENLLESELFGYVKGAFSGARKEGKAGLFEQAHGGTIFLDEIGEMPLRLQATLLRVLEEREVRRLGDDKIIPIDIRVIAATNKDLHEMVGKQMFREDLFYRLNVLLLRIPPLRDRKGDVPLLVKAFSAMYRKKMGAGSIRFSKDAQDLLRRYDWPGNVRELQNVIQRIVLLAESEWVNADWISRVIGTPDTLHAQDENWFKIELNGSFKDVQRQLIDQVLQRSGDKMETARKLGISHMTVYRRLNERLDEEGGRES